MAGKETHGLTNLKRVVRARGIGSLDAKSPAAKALRAWRRDILNSLGGEESLSAMELTVVEQACRNRLILDSVDAWLFEQPRLVNRKRKYMLPVVGQRMAIDAALTRTLTALGLKRREREAPSLKEYLAQKYGDDETPAQEAPEEISGDETQAETPTADGEPKP